MFTNNGTCNSKPVSNVAGVTPARTDADIVFTNTMHDLSVESVFKPDHKYDFSIADADGNTYTVTASVLSYALIAIDANTNEDTVNLCKALWKYSTEAKAYFGNKN